MRIWPHYEKGVTVIDELSLSEIDSMIEALQAIKSKGLKIQENFKEAVEKYKASGSTAVGPMGYYPSNESQLARAEMQYYDHWTNSQTTLRLSTKSASDLNDVDINRKDLNFKLDSLMEKTPIEDMKNYYESETVNGPNKGQRTKRLNLHKVRLLIERALNDDVDGTSESYAPIQQYPYGGTFVIEVIGHYFLCENNIKGVEFVEVSKELHDAFVDEFSKEGDK